MKFALLSDRIRLRIVVTVLFATGMIANLAVAQEKIEWRQDLNHLAEELPKRHVDFFHSLTQEDFDRAVQALESSLDKLSDAQVVLEMNKLIASAGDGHTRLDTGVSWFNYYPINFRVFDDGVHVVAADEKHKAVVGAKVVKFGSLSTEAFLDRVRDYVPHDNEFGFRHAMQNQINTAEFFQQCGAVDDSHQIEMTFELDGNKITQTFRSKKSTEAGKIKWSFKRIKPALYQKKSNLDFWNDWIPEQKTLYFKYNRCQNPKGFNALVNRTKGFIEENDVQRFVLDLRNNGGGNSAVFKPLLDYLSGQKTLNNQGKLFVIIGRQTFSSGMWNAIEMKDKTSAILVGEPTGGKPNHFGEIRSFKLPSSKIKVFYSTRVWTLMRDSNPDALEPDLRVKQLSKDYFEGRDAALQAIFDYKNLMFTTSSGNLSFRFIPPRSK